MTQKIDFESQNFAHLITFTQVTPRLKNFWVGWLLFLGLKEGLVECATVCVKSWVILTKVSKDYCIIVLFVCRSHLLLIFKTYLISDLIFRYIGLPTDGASEIKWTKIMRINFKAHLQKSNLSFWMSKSFFMIEIDYLPLN